MVISRSLPQACRNAAWPQRSAYRVVIVMACLAFIACGAGEPTAFSRGEAIPLGEGTLTVYKAEVTSQFLSSYIGTKTGMTNAVLSFSFYTPQLKEEKTVKEKMKLINSLYLTLVTDEGKKFTTPLILPADQYRMMLAGQAQDLEAVKSYMLGQTSGLVPDDFVAIFVIPQGVKELTVHIYNPAVKEGQARLASVMVW
jgi:hypothetical protein